MTARPRVALATSSGFPDLYDDDRLALPHLEVAGVDAVPAVWDDPSVRWSSFDLVVVRSTWDYTTRRDAFLDWAAAVPRLLNPVGVLRWNTDKRYLAELAAAGVPVVPTAFVEPGDAYEAPAGEHVVKPTVSANAQDTSRFAPGQDSAPHAQALLDAGRSVMVQPYQRAVEADGETAVLFFDGVHSHAARKAPVLVPELADPDDVAITEREASAVELEVARAALAAVPWAEPLLYARVDLVPGADGTPVLMELELTEPSLFLGQSPGAAQRFAQAVRARL